MLYLVAYDIGSDRLRGRVARVLEAFGARVQGSVFEVRLPPSRLHELQGALAALFGGRLAGEVRVYPVCERCYEQAFAIGDIATPVASGGWLVL